MHAIVTLHDLIDSGEIMRRRADNGGGAGVHLDTAGSVEAAPVTLGARG
jgi:hypothetical protein